MNLRQARAHVAWLSAAAACLQAPPARGEVVTGPCSALTDPNNAPVADPRLDHLIVAGVHVNVLVPPRYREAGARDHRYPVLYLFHGAFSDEDSFSTQAAAGFSAGGLDAMIYAARHPDRFVAAGTFSGFVDPFTPTGAQVAQLFAADDAQLCGGNVTADSFWGDPTLHPVGWERGDPTDLAENLRGVALYVGSDNGTPCPDDPNPDPFLVFAEQTVFVMSQAFDAALTAAGVAHVTDFRGCGVHLFSNANHDLRVFWPQMIAAFGRQAPDRFDYRSADASASAWGWTFGADPGRAPEFLEARDASSAGLRLIGSGASSVATGPLFGRGERVLVSGAGAPPFVVRADERGRIAFSVSLGPAHTLEEDTAAEQAAAAANPAYFVTRDVRFSSLGDDGGSRGDPR